MKVGCRRAPGATAKFVIHNSAFLIHLRLLMPKAAAQNPPQTFETAITRLETLVEEMDAANLPLQDLISRYEEGIELVKVCEDRLKDAGKRIEIITRNAAGKLESAEFEPEAPPAAESRPDVSLF